MTARRRITRVLSAPDSAGSVESVGDELTVEAPLNLIVSGESIATLMRTPGHDIELAAGWLTVESGVRSASDLLGLRQCRTSDDLELRAADGVSGRGVDQVHLALAAGVQAPRPRAWVTGAACGVCSADVLDLSPLRRWAAHTEGWTVPAEVLQGLPEQVRQRQRTFQRTGSLHAAALATAAGELLVVREDVGRHNAVDKATGWALFADRLPAADLLLVVSGRVSFEIIQKAVAAGVAGVVAVSAPSDLAVDLARDHDLVLAGMVRPGRMNIYAGGSLVTGLDQAG
ncbi:MAG TPA: formate dehydrogenase accessory sulfurtransferase FdhD [Jatrophihabitans sp.]|uniref:formate dehydrogenase accessory sulfurtransferase FdhD n=1 Tax=Jatrophihabitans sp. TaxID=1932789 RepID=UPI002EF52289